MKYTQTMSILISSNRLNDAEQTRILNTFTKKKLKIKHATEHKIFWTCVTLTNGVTYTEQYP